MRLKTLCCLSLVFVLVATSCADSKAAVIKFSQELVPIEFSHHQLNNWWNVYVARERVPYYEVPLHISRIRQYQQQLEALNSKLMEIQARGELAPLKQLFLEVYARRLFYSTVSIEYYLLGYEQGLEETDRLIDEANQLHGEALRQWNKLLEKYGMSLEQVVEGELSKRKA